MPYEIPRPEDLSPEARREVEERKARARSLGISSREMWEQEKLERLRGDLEGKTRDEWKGAIRKRIESNDGYITGWQRNEISDTVDNVDYLRAEQGRLKVLLEDEELLNSFVSGDEAVFDTLRKQVPTVLMDYEAVDPDLLAQLPPPPMPPLEETD